MLHCLILSQSRLLFQYIIRAPEAGVIDKVPFKVGDSVAKGAMLVHMVANETKDNGNGGDESE